MSWREIFRRFVRLFLPHPKSCPNCGDVGCIVDDRWQVTKDVLEYKWHCESCGYVREGIA